MTFPSNAAYHGPDTVEHFDEFSMDTVVSECKEYAPDLLKLLMRLGQTDRFVPVSDASSSNRYNVAELKALMSLFTLIKCRSKKVLGIQLLLTFMLIARSASRQVIKVLTLFHCIIYSHKPSLTLINCNTLYCLARKLFGKDLNLVTWQFGK